MGVPAAESRQRALEAWALAGSIGRDGQQPESGGILLLVRRRLGVGVAALLVAVSSFALPAAGATSLSLTTDDGLRLLLDQNGSVSGVRLGGTAVPRVANGGGLSLRMVGGAANLLTNPGFDRDADTDRVPDGWRFAGTDRRPVLDRQVRRGTSGASVRLSAGTEPGSGSVSTTLTVAPATNYTLSAWMRSQEILPSVATAKVSTFRVMVEQLSGTGAVLVVDMASGYSGTAGWHRQFGGFETGAGVTRVRITGLLSGGYGTGWIDDLHVARLLHEQSLPVRGSLTRSSANVLRQNARLADQQLSVAATYTAKRDHIRVDGMVTSLAPADTAFQVTYTLPVDAKGWKWGDYARRERTIGRGRYAYVTSRSLQQTSRYPFSVVSSIYNRRASLSLAMPLEVPRIARMEYGPAGLSITFD
ncbi:MAG: hypothetical protein ACR2JZ_05270, partial [Candidatus Limnocylindrales bacterium]